MNKIFALVGEEKTVNVYFAHQCGSADAAFGENVRENWLPKLNENDFIIVIFGCLWYPNANTLKRLEWANIRCNNPGQSKAIFCPCTITQYEWLMHNNLPTFKCFPYFLVDTRKYYFVMSI
jgi:hypothetical protein